MYGVMLCSFGFRALPESLKKFLRVGFKETQSISFTSGLGQRHSLGRLRQCFACRSFSEGRGGMRGRHNVCCCWIDKAMGLPFYIEATLCKHYALGSLCGSFILQFINFVNCDSNKTQK